MIRWNTDILWPLSTGDTSADGGEISASEFDILQNPDADSAKLASRKVLKLPNGTISSMQLLYTKNELSNSLIEAKF